MTKEVRRLAAVMFTDIVGYSSLTQEDEELALGLLEEHRNLLRPLFQKYSGKEIKTIGDAFLVEFPSAVKAVECAREIQGKIGERNSALPSERRIRLRIGVHLGDIIHKQGDIYGDGVNIASRIQSLAEPGGICLTEEMVAQVRNKIKEPIVSLGIHRLKNIEEPKQLFQMVLPWSEGSRLLTGRLQKSPGAHQPKRRLLFPLALIPAFVAGAGLFVLLRFSSAPSPEIKALAVLPLQNLSADPEQEYFADGMSEALITELSKIKALRIISRTSVMRYKQTDKSLPEIARELGVEALIEGSALLTGERVRITTQLIQARPEKHLWAQDYEEDLKNILALQRRVAEAVAGEIKVTLTPEDQARLVRADQVNPDTHRAYLKGVFFIHKFTEEAVKTGIALFEEAIDKDPRFAPLYAGLAESYDILTSAAWVSPREGWPMVKKWADKAVSLDKRLSMPHVLLADFRFLVEWDFEGAEQEFQKAIELNPGNSTAHQYYAIYLAAMGRMEESVREIKKAFELDPLSLTINQSLGAIYRFSRQYDLSVEQLKTTLALDPNFAWTYWSFGEVYTIKGQYEEAVASFDKALALSEDNMAYVAAGKAMAYALWGKKEESRNILARLLAVSGQKYVPPFCLATVYGALGEKDEAFSWLEKAYREKSNYLIFLNVDPRLDSLRGDQRLEDLRKKIGL